MPTTCRGGMSRGIFPELEEKFHGVEKLWGGHCDRHSPWGNWVGGMGACVMVDRCLPLPLFNLLLKASCITWVSEYSMLNPWGDSQLGALFHGIYCTGKRESEKARIGKRYNIYICMYIAPLSYYHVTYFNPYSQPIPFRHNPLRFELPDTHITPRPLRSPSCHTIPKSMYNIHLT